MIVKREFDSYTQLVAFVSDTEGQYACISTGPTGSAVTVASYNDDLPGWSLDLDKTTRDLLVAALQALPL